MHVDESVGGRCFGLWLLIILKFASLIKFDSVKLDRIIAIRLLVKVRHFVFI